VTIVPFSATRRIGIDAAEALLSEWLGASGLDEANLASGRTKEEAPRPRGMARGPKYPR